MFFVDYLIFLLTFRGLTSPKASLPVRVRMALAALVIFITTLATLWFVPSAWGLLFVVAAAAIGSLGMHGQGLSRLTEALGRLRFPLYLLSVGTLAALVFLYVPIMTFLTSPGELSVHLDYLISVNARDAMLIIYVGAAAYALAMTPRMRTVLAVLALNALVLALVYSYVLPFGYPMMSGLTFEKIPISGATRLGRLLLDAALLVAVALGLYAALLRFGARQFIVGILLVNVSLGIAAGVSVFRDGAGEAGGPDATARLSEQPLRFSRTQPNVLIIFLDRFMGSYVESILESDPALAERLEGFTWYPRSVSAGENSIAGVHPMLGGYDYTPVEMNARHKSLRDLSVEAFSILPYNFSHKGYRVNFVSPRGLGFTMAGDCRFLQMDGVSCTHIPLSVVKRRAEQMQFPLNDLSKSSYADLLVLLGSMRVAPYAVKEVLMRKGPWRPFLDHSAGTTFTQWAELQAFDDLSRTDATERNLNFISNILPHEPYYMGENCVPQRSSFEASPEEVRRRGHASLFSLQHSIAARCTLLAVADYLDFLKTQGVYRNTKIAIVSDHGIVGPVEDHSTRAVAGGSQGNVFVRLRPLVLMKEVGASGPLKVSDVFTPNAEVPRMVCTEIGGCINPYLNGKTIEAHGRDDPFFVSLVPWQFNLQKPDAFVINTQLVLKGKDPFDSKGWAVVK
jgi:hypothetical protein